MIRFKKTAGILLILALLCIAACVLAEGGNTIDTATPIALNTPVQDQIYDYQDVDYFKITLPEDGYVQIGFKHDYVDRNQIMWKVSLVDSDGDAYCQVDMYGNVMNERFLPATGLAAGIYYIRVAPYYTSDASYTLTANYSASNYWEKEWNNTPVKATFIQTNQQYNGAIGHYTDEDYYKFTLPADGFVNISFKHEYIDDSRTFFKLYLENSDANEYAYREMSGNQMNAVQCGDIGLPAGTYYLQIKPYYHNSDPYSFTVSYTASDAWETEFNDTPPTADPIETGKWYSGAIGNRSEKDYFKFTLPKASDMTVSFKHDYIDDYRTFWQLYIYRLDDQNNLPEVYSHNFAGSGDLDFTSDPITLQPGTYFVEIKDYYYSNSTYQLKVTTKEGTKPTGISLNKKKATLTIGDTLQLKATMTPSTAESTLIWSSGNTSVAKVDENGIVQAVAKGTTVITVKTENGLEASCKITVKAPKPTSVKLNKKGTVKLKVGKKLALKATLKPSNAETKLTWKSSRKSVATVNSKGVVTTKKKGTTVITVKTSNGLTASVKIRVR